MNVLPPTGPREHSDAQRCKSLLRRHGSEDAWQKEANLARTNYGYDKRRKEIAKKKKQEEKRQRKRDKGKTHPAGESDQPSTEGQVTPI